MKGCINSAGVKYRWGYKKWTRTEWPHAQSYQVNLSPWMCDACRQRVAREVQAGAASISLRASEGARLRRLTRQNHEGEGEERQQDTGQG